MKKLNTPTDTFSELVEAIEKINEIVEWINKFSTEEYEGESYIDPSQTVPVEEKDCCPNCNTSAPCFGLHCTHLGCGGHLTELSQLKMSPEREEAEKSNENIRKAYESGIKQEREAWLDGRRCDVCGRAKEPNTFSDTCGKCWEEE